MADKHEKIKKRGFFASTWRRLCRNRLSVIGMTILSIFILAAVFADVIAPYPYSKQDLRSIGLSPSAQHLFGTDNLGRDLFSRVIYGARVSLRIGFVSTMIALICGGILGSITGFYAGKADMIIMRIIDMMMAIPSVLLAIVISASLGPGVRNLMIAIGISSIPSYTRIVRASILSLRGDEFIEAARLCGDSDFRIIWRHIFPNILAPVIVQVTLGMALCILNASSLSFLGLGVQAPQPEWGSMLADGRSYIRQYPHIVLFPGLAIVFLVLSLNMIGDGLRDALDPRMKN
ncbi:MAG: ABC transporter permease [Anaerolineaceae bacterium]|nr:ABC transporter permease [Anaerolineaceae bacterium]